MKMLMIQKFGLIILIALFSVLKSTVVPCAEDPGQKGSQGPPPTPVEVALVVEDMVSEQIVLVGTTEPKTKSIIAAEEEGLVESFPVKEGDHVKKGDVLALLKSTDLHIRLKAAMAAKGEAEARYRFAEKELARSSKLKDTNSIAAKSYDQALYEFQALEQQVLRYIAEIEELKYRIRKTRVTAPFSGFIAEEHTEVGEWMEKGGKVVSLVDLSLMRITVDVPERYIMEIHPGVSAQVRVEASSIKPFEGTISAILPEGDPDSRTFPVKIDVDNSDLELKSGMEARVTFNLGSQTKALLVPKDAMVSANGGRMVFVVDNGVVRPVNISIVGTYGTNVAVNASLKPGDQVVVRGNERLMPGQPVTIKP
jgi:RND family efflux transporter MFP subunit